MEAWKKSALDAVEAVGEDVLRSGHCSAPDRIFHAAMILFFRKLFDLLSRGALSFLPDVDLPKVEVSFCPNHPPEPRLPGAIYEAFMSRSPRLLEGAFRLEKTGHTRKSRGSYYTPRRVVRRIVEQTLDPSDLDELRVLDPAVGSGFFLLEAADFLGGSDAARRRAVVEHCLYGVDVDSLAAEVARQSLRLLVNDPDLDVHVRTGDTLFGSWLEHREAADQEARARYSGRAEFFHWPLEFPEVMAGRGGFSAVIGNPPYGDVLSRRAKEALPRFGYPPTGGRAEISAHFIHQGLNLLAPGGRLSYILPNTLLLGRQFGALRESITSRAQVLSVLDFRTERVFPEAEVYGMILLLESGQGPAEYEADCHRPDGPHERIRIVSGSSRPWRRLVPLVERLEAKGVVEPLSEVARCRDAGLDYKHKAVGWGERGSRPSLSRQLVYSGVKRHDQDKPFLRGRHIEPFHLKESDEFLVHDWKRLRTKRTTVIVYPEVTEVEVKIVTRQTSDRLVAAIDRKGRYTAKSVHTIVVNHGDYTPEYICALLNSSVMNRIYAARTLETGRTFAQVRICDLRELPVRKAGSEEQAEVTEMVRRMERSCDESLISELDRIFERLYEA